MSKHRRASVFLLKQIEAEQELTESQREVVRFVIATLRKFDGKRNPTPDEARRCVAIIAKQLVKAFIRKK